jgi:hypothetical protein
VSADSSVALVGGSNDNGGVGATWAFAQRPGNWIQEQKLVGAGAARKLASSVPPAADAALMGRSEDRGRVGAAADSQDGVRPCTHKSAWLIRPMSTYSPTAAQKQTFECRRTAERSHKRASYRLAQHTD